MANLLESKVQTDNALLNQENNVLNNLISSSPNSILEAVGSQKGEEKIINSPSLTELSSTNTQYSFFVSQEDEASTSVENVIKRVKTEDQSNEKIIISSISDIDLEEDISKREKLVESQPNTSINESDDQSNTKNVSAFRKIETKVRKRNYRNQSSSSNAIDDLNDCTKETENINEDTSSSDSLNSEEDLREDFESSSDEENRIFRENVDSNESSTSNEDDKNELPAILQKEPSKCNWSIIQDVVNRQIGFNNSIPCRFYSSLHAVQRLELMYKLEEHVGCVNALGFNQKGNLLASASDDLSITIWDWAIGKKRVVLHSVHQSNVFQSKWLPLDVECFVVSCARDGQVRLIDIRTSVTRRLARHRKACHKISTHLDLPHVVLSAGEDSDVLSIDVRESKPSKLLSVKDNDRETELYSIHSNPLNNFEFCVSGQSSIVKVYDRRKLMVPLYQLCPKHLSSQKLAYVTCAVYNHNGTEIVASYNRDDIYLFDATGCQSSDFLHRYQGHRNSATVKGVNFFGPNSEFVLSGSDCGNIFIWDKKTEAIVQWMPGDEKGIVNAVEPHPHIPILATSGLDYDVKIWIPSREETLNVKQKMQSCVKKNLTDRATDEDEIEFDDPNIWFMLLLRAEIDRQRWLRRTNQNIFENNSDTDDEAEMFNEDNDSSNSSTTNSSNSNESDSHSEI